MLLPSVLRAWLDVTGLYQRNNSYILLYFSPYNILEYPSILYVTATICVLFFHAQITRMSFLLFFTVRVLLFVLTNNGNSLTGYVRRKKGRNKGRKKLSFSTLNFTYKRENISRVLRGLRLQCNWCRNFRQSLLCKSSNSITRATKEENKKTEPSSIEFDRSIQRHLKDKDLFHSNVVFFKPSCIQANSFIFLWITLRIKHSPPKTFNRWC